jgi:hypothetical protein
LTHPPLSDPQRLNHEIGWLTEGVIVRQATWCDSLNWSCSLIHPPLRRSPKQDRRRGSFRPPQRMGHAHSGRDAVNAVEPGDAGVATGSAFEEL